MLCSKVGEVRIQDDILKALLKEPRDQHTKDNPTKTAVLTIGFADFNANFRNRFTHFSVAGFTDQPPTFFQDQATITQSCDYFFIGFYTLCA